MRTEAALHGARLFPGRRVLLTLLLGVFSIACDVAPTAAPAHRDRPEVRNFIKTLVERHGFEARSLARLLDEVHVNPEVAALVAPPQTPDHRNWRVYRSRFVEPQRIRAGVAFWRSHAEVLTRTEKEFGIPAEILVGILGVETIYGRQMGRFPVLETLVTLAFDYPEAPNRAERSALFLHELEEYLVWCRDTGQDPTRQTGSYAGAIGMPQFLPSSLRTCAVDYDKDGHIDLHGSADDAIGSVANFLKIHGWRPGRPVLWRVPRARKALEALTTRADGDPHPKWRMGELLDAGVLPQGVAPRHLRAFRKAERETKVVIVDLASPDRPTEYRIGLDNFYVITRYNRSFFYAASVADLGRAVRLAAKRK